MCLTKASGQYLTITALLLLGIGSVNCFFNNIFFQKWQSFLFIWCFNAGGEESCLTCWANIFNSCSIGSISSECEGHINITLTAIISSQYPYRQQKCCSEQLNFLHYRMEKKICFTHVWLFFLSFVFLLFNTIKMFSLGYYPLFFLVCVFMEKVLFIQSHQNFIV